jgi:hypothetical protein
VRALCNSEGVESAWAWKQFYAAERVALSDHRFGDFAQLTEHHHSDFRDTGPVLAHLVGRGFQSEIHDLSLVDYAGVLDAASPSWVAGALVTVDLGCSP